MDVEDLANTPDISKEKKTFGKRFAVYYLSNRLGTVAAEDESKAKRIAENKFNVEIDGEQAYLDYEGHKGKYEGDDGEMHLDIFTDLPQVVVNEASQHLKLQEVL